jgi:putative membrane protein
MKLIVDLLIGFIALEHVYILWLEMFAWETAGRKVFKGALPKELFTPTKVMAANQGLYNGFLAAGLIWTFFIETPEWKFNIALFFLSCIVVAGIYGALTASRRIFWVQGMPALVAIGILLFSK